MSTNLSPASRLRLSATSSRQALDSLSTRSGRFLSRSKVMVQRFCILGMTGVGGGAGVATTIDVLAVAFCPWSSITRQVTVILPGLAPAVVSPAVGPAPAMTPLLVV